MSGYEATATADQDAGWDHTSLRREKASPRVNSAIPVYAAEWTVSRYPRPKRNDAHTDDGQKEGILL